MGVLCCGSSVGERYISGVTSASGRAPQDWLATTEANSSAIIGAMSAHSDQSRFLEPIKSEPFRVFLFFWGGGHARLRPTLLQQTAATAMACEREPELISSSLEAQAPASLRAPSLEVRYADQVLPQSGKARQRIRDDNMRRRPHVGRKAWACIMPSPVEESTARPVDERCGGSKKARDNAI